MTEGSNVPRRYDDEQVERILARAAELESERPAAPARADGLTLAELEQIGAEAGLRPELLRRAARELDRGGPSGHDPYRTLLGAPPAIRLQREVEGETLPSDLERLIAELRRFDGSGHAAVVGNVLSWQSGGGEDLRTLGVTVSSSQGQTRIWVAERLGRLAAALHGGIVGGVGGGVGLGVGLAVGLGVLGSAVFAVAVPALTVAGSYALARSLFRSRYHERAAELSELMERLVSELEGGRLQE